MQLNPPNDVRLQPVCLEPRVGGRQPRGVPAVGLNAYGAHRRPSVCNTGPKDASKGRQYGRVREVVRVEQLEYLDAHVAVCVCVCACTCVYTTWEGGRDRESAREFVLPVLGNIIIRLQVGCRFPSIFMLHDC